VPKSKHRRVLSAAAKSLSAPYMAADVKSSSMDAQLDVYFAKPEEPLPLSLQPGFQSTLAVVNQLGLQPLVNALDKTLTDLHRKVDNVSEVCVANNQANAAYWREKCLPLVGKAKRRGVLTNVVGRLERLLVDPCTSGSVALCGQSYHIALSKIMKSSKQERDLRWDILRVLRDPMKVFGAGAKLMCVCPSSVVFDEGCDKDNKDVCSRDEPYGFHIRGGSLDVTEAHF